MIEILPSPPHAAAFRFQGTLTGEDYDRCIAGIESRLSAHDRIGIYSDLAGMTGVTPEAMGKDLRFALAHMGEFHRFARGAIVTGSEWLARATRFAAMFFPRTEIRTFEPGEAEAAMAWASEAPPPA